MPLQMHKDLSCIDFKRLREQYEAVCFDKDNCVTLPYENEIYPPLKESVEECKQIFGIRNVAMLSNSVGGPDDSPPDYPQVPLYFLVHE